jgi:sulfatase modifying factor 1
LIGWVLFFPIIAASLVLWSGTSVSQALGGSLAVSLASDEGSAAAPVRYLGEDGSSAIGLLPGNARRAKRPPSKSRFMPKRKKRTTLTAAVTAHQPVAASIRLTRDSAGCLPGMVSIGGAYCIDMFEASLVEDLPDGAQREWPYYEVVPATSTLRAVSTPNVYPQGYISGIQAREACERSGKRLCRPDEWRNACMGPHATIFPYGDVREVGRCNDNGRSSLRFFNPHLDSNPDHRWMWGHGGNMVDPRLNQLEGTLTRTGERAGCTNEYGVFDMVGNLHEWVDDPDGTFQGGYYLDTHQNGDGCQYRTTAHPMEHLDYSTGFRCCANSDQ